jgi:acetolactate synthase-1/2/3 large subunit
MIKLSDYVFKFVTKLGVKKVFLLPGGGCMHLVDSLGHNSNLEPFCCLHEQAAVIGADAYSQYTNNIGVALVTAGPGSTNAITGVAGSWIDSVPLLVLSGQAKRKDLMTGKGVRQMGIQEVDIVSMVKGITKYAVTVMEPEKIKYHLSKAVFLAHNGRPGPVWVDIPLDVQGTQINEDSLEKFEQPQTSAERDKKIKQFVNRTIEILNNSDRPVILAGNGIRMGKATEKFLELINILGVPVLTTWKALDLLPENCPLFFGRPGSIASRYANFIQQTSDCVIIIGTRLDLTQVGHNYKGFAPNAKKIVVDIDQTEINKLDMDNKISICADAGLFVSEFLKQISTVQKKKRLAWLNKCSGWKNKYPIILPEYKDGKYANPYHLIDILSELMDENDILVPGSSGSCSEITLQAFRVKVGQRVFNNPGLGSMGYGLPAAIGACLAGNGKRTIAIIGDGGLQHNIQELANVVRLNMPLKIFILNNDGYASIRATQTKFFNSHFVCCDPASGLPMPNIEKIARAYDIEYLRINNNSDLKKKVAIALESKYPVICELIVDPELPTMPRLSSEVLPDGKMVSKPLEDLWPFLDRDEFKSNMIVKSAEE